MTTPLHIACIGSRETPPHILQWMEETGAAIVRLGFTIVSGNAPGADQAWARGGNSVDPDRVELCLPWESFEALAVHSKNTTRALHDRAHKRYFDIAEANHPARSRLTPGGQRLHARKPARSAAAVVGWFAA